MWPLLFQLIFLTINTFPVARTQQDFNLATLKPIIAQNIIDIQPTITDHVSIECSKIMETMCGPLPAFGKVDTESIYFRFQQAYHAAIPANDNWYESWTLLVKTRDTLRRLRYAQADWKRLTEFETVCNNAVKDFEALPGGADQTIRNKLINLITECAEENLVIAIRTNADEVKHRMYTSCYESLDLVMSTFVNSGGPLSYNNFNYYPFNWSLFGLMYNETEDFDKEVHKRLTVTFPQYISDLQGKGQHEEAIELENRLKEIVARLKDPALPYHEIYFAGDEVARDNKRLDDVISWYNFYDAYDTLYKYKLGGPPGTNKNFTEDFLPTWENDAIFVDDFNNGYVDYYVTKITDYYYYAFYARVNPSTKPMMENGVLVRDGKWDWDPSIPMHNMRLAWDLMGAVLEEIKCYMKETYFFDLRQEALSRTQRDIEKGALYSGFSRSILAPCRIIDDLDLVGPFCNRANNEICAPMRLNSLQRTDSIHHEGFNLLKPKWIYKYDKVSKRCKGRRDYVMKMNTCRCGFRLDCGKDLGVNLTCQLIENDVLRGQCRGHVGYPCYTLPLSPKKFHETCRSGYCNYKKNSCEDRPYTYHTSGGASLFWKVKSWNEEMAFWALVVVVGVAFL